MNILMMTNTYAPHVGGVARSVEAFADEYRRHGNRVLVVAPEFPDTPEQESDVIRLPAIQEFNGSDFSVRLPIPGFLNRALREFQPEIVHAHHPFLLGDAALRAAAARDAPLVFTHHTMYERYTHYVPGDSPPLRRFVIDLSTGYANLCDCVFAPSESVADVIGDRGVMSRIEVVPTGVDRDHFAHGNGPRMRRELGIPAEAFVVGHLGRLAPEKNLGFLGESVAAFLQRKPDAHFLVVGSGPSQKDLLATFEGFHAADRLHLAGTRTGSDLVDAYHAMDVFAFASCTETQGMVLTEAMAAGLPVVALDASGAREVVEDAVNGRLLPEESVDEFADALNWVLDLDPAAREEVGKAVRRTAEAFSMASCAAKALEIYASLTSSERGTRLNPDVLEDNPWQTARRRIEAEWDIWSTRAHAASAALRPDRREEQERRGVLRWFSRLPARLRRVLKGD